MKVLLSFLLLSLCGTLVRSNVNFGDLQPPWAVINGKCNYSGDVILRYRTALYDFTTKIYKQIALRSGNHFVFSPLSIWLLMATVVESTEGSVQNDLLKLLNLPEDRCLRQQFYIIATRSEYPGNDVTLSRTRLVLFDEDVVLNKRIENFVLSNWLTGIKKSPLKRDPNWTLNLIRKIFSMQLPNIDLSGNSIVLDSLDYNGLWSSAFSEAIMERAPFYDDFGHIIGSVNMMRLRKHFRLAYLPDVRLKCLELPVGYNNRYRLIYAITIGNDSLDAVIKSLKGDIILQMVDNLKFSQIPIDVSIPQFTATSEIDMRSVMEQFGVKSLWTDPNITRSISTPPSLPSGFVQRVTLTLERPKLVPFNQDSVLKPRDLIYEDTGLDEDIGKDFIANRPFGLIMVDTLTKSCIFASAFSTPPPQFYQK